MVFVLVFKNMYYLFAAKFLTAKLLPQPQAASLCGLSLTAKAERMRLSS